MTSIASDTFYEDMWDKHHKEYIQWCNDHNINADLSDFSIWLEEQKLVPEPDYAED